MKILTLVIFIAVALLGDDTKLLTETKQKIIMLKKEQIVEKESINEYKWLSDININASIQKDHNNLTNQDYALSVSQEVFNFGGISSQIEYAKALQRLENINLDITTNEDINALYALLIDIKINELELQKSKLNIKNRVIDISQKKSEYSAGEIGISDLNDAIIIKNNLVVLQQDIILLREKNILNLKEYTQREYKSFKVPDIGLVDKELFMQNATSVRQALLSTNRDETNYKIKKSEYLPSLSVDGQYGYRDTDLIQGDDYYQYGVSVSMPISYTTSNDIQQSKLEYLIAKQNYHKQKYDIELFYNSSVVSIESYKEKIKLADEDISLYEDLISVNQEEYEAGYKTLDDVESLNNSRKVRELDRELYKLNIQKTSLDIFYKTILTDRFERKKV